MLRHKLYWYEKWTRIYYQIGSLVKKVIIWEKTTKKIKNHVIAKIANVNVRTASVKNIRNANVRTVSVRTVSVRTVSVRSVNVKIQRNVAVVINVVEDLEVNEVKLVLKVRLE
jgi:hypothetical protein